MFDHQYKHPLPLLLFDCSSLCLQVRDDDLPLFACLPGFLSFGMSALGVAQSVRFGLCRNSIPCHFYFSGFSKNRDRSYRTLFARKSFCG